MIYEGKCANKAKNEGDKSVFKPFHTLYFIILCRNVQKGALSAVFALFRGCAIGVDTHKFTDLVGILFIDNIFMP